MGRARDLDAGVVDEHVDAAELVDGLPTMRTTSSSSETSPCTSTSRTPSWRTRCTQAWTCSSVLGRLVRRRQVVDRDVGAVLGEAHGDRLADARGAAGDEDVLALDAGHALGAGPTWCGCHQGLLVGGCGAVPDGPPALRVTRRLRPGPGSPCSHPAHPRRGLRRDPPALHVRERRRHLRTARRDGRRVPARSRRGGARPRLGRALLRAGRDDHGHPAAAPMGQSPGHRPMPTASPATRIGWRSTSPCAGGR